MRIVAGAIGGGILGGLLGWFLPGLFFSRPHEFELLALFAFQILGAGVGAMLGFIFGGALAAKHLRGQPTEPSEGRGRQGVDSPDRSD